MRWITGVALLAWGCGADTEPPLPVGPFSAELCVQTDIEGESLRVMAVYFVRDQLHEVAADVSFDGPRACLTVAPPQRDADIEWRFADPVGNRDEDVAVWPIDLAVYDDLNADGQVSAGELRGRLSTHAYDYPAWFPRFGRLRPNRPTSLTLDQPVTPAPFVSARIWPLQSATWVDDLPEVWTVNAKPGCEDAIYPACIGRVVDQRNAAGLPMHPPGYMPSSHPSEPTRWRAYEPPAYPPAECWINGDDSAVAYFTRPRFDPIDRCACIQINEGAVIHYHLSDPPDDFTCEAKVMPAPG